jgi:hypothetical protein
METPRGISEPWEIWTVWPGVRAEGGREAIVVVPLFRPLEPGFARARALLDEGAAVRLVGQGVTMREHWPAWVSGVAQPLALTEIDVYLPRDKSRALLEIRPALEAWIDRVLERAVPGMRPTDVFWSSAAERMFRPLVSAWLIGSGLAAAHPRGAIECTEPEWLAMRICRERRGEAAGPARREPRWKTWGAYAGVAAAAVGQRLLEFARERPSRVKRARVRDGAAGRPTVWIALSGGWPRSNRPVVEGVPPAARARGEPVAVLLQGSLAPGLRTGALPTDVERGPVLPALDDPAVHDAAAVDQGISVERWSDLARVIAAAAPASLSAAWRAFREPLAVTGLEVELPWLPLAKLVAVDVLRAREAARASEALLERRDFQGATVLFPHATAVNDRVVDQRLQGAGATTVELVHGGLGEASIHLTSARTGTRVKVFWSRYEAEVLGPLEPGQRCVGGFLPRPLGEPSAPRWPEPGAPVPVLLASSYLPSGWGIDPRIVEHYQEPFLREALAVPGVKLRWRPHPADDPVRIDRLCRRFPALERSVGTLEEDLAWARVLVTSVSSIIIEALFAGLPVFVHEVPFWEASVYGAFDEARRFGGRRRLVELLGPCLLGLARRDAEALAPEARARERLFGPSQRPWPAAELLQMNREPADPY